jgi:hypothetical protein
MLLPALVTTILIAFGVVWLGVSVLFILALCLAARRPMPAPENSQISDVHADIETAVCAR